jgi:large subunit ribosomal protein L22
VEAKATARFVRIKPYKVRRVLALIRGRDLAEALAALDFTASSAAPQIRKVVDSAAANAEANHGMNRERLWVRRAYADEGPSLRRYRAGSIGRGGVIKRRMSHITVVVDERPEAAAPRGPRRRAAPAKGKSQ